MGLLMDTLEDNTERLGTLVPLAQTAVSVEPRGPSTWRTLDCPSCPRSFLDERQLQDHLFDAHRHGTFYLRVNGQVAGLFEYLDQPLASLTVVALGSDRVELDAEGFGRTVRALSVSGGETLDLLQALGLPPTERGRVWVRGRLGALHRQHQIYVLDPPHIKFDALDQLVFQAQEPLLSGGEPRWRDLRDHSASALFSPLERRYLNGFAEYLLGCHLEQRGDSEAAGRFEEAFGKLGIYSSNLARSTLAVLALKMNAFDLLLQSGPRSTFWAAANFYRCPVVVPDHLVAERVQGDGIWMDEFQEGILRAVEYFFRGAPEAADDEVRRLPRHLLAEPNNRVKQLVLLARVAAQLGDTDLSLRAYQQLVDDHVFGIEARSALS